MNIIEQKDEFNELQEYECNYRIAMLGLIHPDNEKIENFLSVEKEYVKTLRKMIRYLKQEITSAEAIKKSILSNGKEENQYDN